MVELTGLEPVAYTLRTYRSSQLSYSPTWTNGNAGYSNPVAS